jgi:hypothetical protein
LRHPPSMRPGRRRLDPRPREPPPCRSRAPDLGTTVMPLDGGALTLRWTRAPARGLAVAPLGRRRLSRSLARSGEKTEAPGGGGSKWPRVSRSERRRGICSAEIDTRPLISIRRLRLCRALLGLFRPRREEEMAARAQVVSPAAACARAGAQAGALTRLGPTQTRASPFTRGLLHACGPSCCWAAAKSFGPAGLV